MMTFQSYDSPDAALEALNAGSLNVNSLLQAGDPCATPNQSGVIVKNQSSWTIKVMFMQLKSTVPPQPGYSADTGTFVAAVNAGPGTNSDVNPCRAGGKNQPILANWIQYNAKMTINHNGQVFERDLPTRTHQSAPGMFIGRQAELRIVNQPTLADEPTLPEFNWAE